MTINYKDMHCKRMLNPPRMLFTKINRDALVNMTLSFDALQMQQEADLQVFNDETCIL